MYQAALREIDQVFFNEEVIFILSICQKMVNLNYNHKDIYNMYFKNKQKIDHIKK